MDVFCVVKDNVTARQVAEYYGMKIGRNGMACCPFHDDKHPSMKLDKRYYCFGCGEKGDAIDFVGKYFDMTSKDAAMKIADDFGLEYKSEKYKPPQKPLKPKKTLEQEFREAQDYCFEDLSDYLHLLKEWKIKYAPKSMDEEWHPLFCEALDNIDQTEYLWDTLLNGDVRDREAMEIYRRGQWELKLPSDIQKMLKDRQQNFMPEDTKAGMIQAFLDAYKGNTVCSKLLYKEALDHPYNDPQYWELREICDIMNQSIVGWKYFSNPRTFAGYGRQRGWERDISATKADNSGDIT